jgi:TolB-like protein/Tfp pilus assembly protein PilF
MACYEGETLKDRIARGPLDEIEAVELAAQVAGGLGEAHEKGIVHRDIKPANLMITRKSQVKMLDFGLAKLAGQTGVTVAGTAMGTVAYMSPEQAEGKEVDGRTDLWSLGVVLYEMLTGRRPFTGPHPQAVIRSVLNDEPEPAVGPRKGMVRGLGEVIARALAKDRSERYQAAGAMMDDLVRVRESLRYPGAETIQSSSRPSIAVLPFVNLSGDPEQEYFCDGITEELINALTQVEGLRVVARTSSFAFKGKHEDIREIGSKLGVDTLVEGSVRKSGDRLRITAQVVKVADGYHLWSEKFDRELKDIFDIQDEISEQVASKLRGDFTATPKGSMGARHGNDVDAYSLYLKGRYFWNKRDMVSLRKAIEFFREAIRRFPDYALAHIGLADCYVVMSGNGLASAKECFPEALTAARKALELDDSLAEVHATLGWIKGFFDVDWDGAEREFKRAMELNPDYATAHQWRAAFLAFSGRSDEAIGEVEVGIALDPLSLSVGTAFAMILLIARRYEDAVRQCERVLEMHSDFGPVYSMLAFSYLGKGMPEKAVEVLEDSLRQDPDHPHRVADMACVYATVGMAEKAEALYHKLKDMPDDVYVPAYVMAQVCTAMGKTDEAFEYLDKVIDERYGLYYAKTDERLEALRSDRRFKVFMEKAGLT